MDETEYDPRSVFRVSQPSKFFPQFHTCEHCDKQQELLVMLLNDGGYGGASYCEQCLVKALDAVRAAKGQE